MKYKPLVGLVYAVLVSGCGGGGGGDSSSSVPETSAEGLWNGAASWPVGYDGAISILVLDDGTYWAWLSSPYYTVKDEYMVHGYGISQKGSFTSTEGDGVMFNFAGSSNGVNPIALNASYVEEQSFSGTFTDAFWGLRIGFATSYDADYKLAPSLSIIAGTYSGGVQATGGNAYTFSDFYRSGSATVTISATGDINGNTDGGCLLSGTVAPRYRGNVYDLQIYFSGGTDACPLSDPVTGIAYFEAPTNTLYGPAVTDTGYEGFLFYGTKL